MRKGYSVPRDFSWIENHKLKRNMWKLHPLKSLKVVNWLLSFLNKNKKIEQKHKSLSDQIGIVGKSCSRGSYSIRLNLIVLVSKLNPVKKLTRPVMVWRHFLVGAILWFNGMCKSTDKAERSFKEIQSCSPDLYRMQGERSTCNENKSLQMRTFLHY